MGPRPLDPQTFGTDWARPLDDSPIVNLAPGDHVHTTALKRGAVKAKETKTKTEMAGLIAVKIGVGLTFVKVIADPALGWHPLVVALPTRAADLQERAELAAVELRELYDLAD
jgi:hypothetical protein